MQPLIGVDTWEVSDLHPGQLCGAFLGPGAGQLLLVPNRPPPPNSQGRVPGHHAILCLRNHQCHVFHVNVWKF